MTYPTKETLPTNNNNAVTPVSVVTVDSDNTPTPRTKRALYSPNQSRVAIAVKKNKETLSNQRKKAKATKWDPTKPFYNNVKILRIKTEPENESTLLPVDDVIILPHDKFDHRATIHPIVRKKNDPCKIQFFMDCPNVVHQVVKPSLDGKKFHVSGTYWKEGKEKTIEPECMVFACPSDWENKDIAIFINTNLRPTWHALLRTPSGQKTYVSPYQVSMVFPGSIDIVTRKHWGKALLRPEDVVLCVRAGFENQSMTFCQWDGLDPNHIYSTCWPEGEIQLDMICKYELITMSFFGNTKDETRWNACINGKREDEPAVEDYKEQLKAVAQLKIDKANAALMQASTRNPQIFHFTLLLLTAPIHKPKIYLA